MILLCKNKTCIIIALIVFAMTTNGCKENSQSNKTEHGDSLILMSLLYSPVPVLNSLTIIGKNSSSITLAQPTLFITGNPYPTILAFIGEVSLITLTGSTVGGTITEGPIDVSAGPYTFNSLAGNTVYRIYVVAQNAGGYSVQTIIQSTD